MLAALGEESDVYQRFSKLQVAIPVAALIVDLHFQLDGTENHHGNRPLSVFMGEVLIKEDSL